MQSSMCRLNRDVTLWVFACCVVLGCMARSPGSNRPVIAVMTQTDWKRNESIYISATYVKFLEQTGAAVVPIRYNMKDSYYDKIFNSVNGILIPGGTIHLDQNNEFTRIGKIMYAKAIEANNRGDYFPIWATCLGFEFITILTNDNVNTLSQCSAVNVNRALNYTSSGRSSRLMSSVSPSLVEHSANYAITQNNHEFCVSTKDWFQNKKLVDFYDVISVNKDVNGIEFISTIESKKYPFYATQWHPEKNGFNYDSNVDIDHTKEAIKFSFEIAQFFIQEAYKSKHQFNSLADESSYLIQNSCPYYKGSPTFGVAYIYREFP